jgi:glycosyltransferase involved in cell wall biosynthesis
MPEAPAPARAPSDQPLADPVLPISVVILTFNAADTIGATLASVRDLSGDIHVVDSGSTDATLEIAAAAGAIITRHPFESYGAQRNWAIDTLALAHPWQLHLDADERVSDGLAAELRVRATVHRAGSSATTCRALSIFTASRSAMAACGRSTTCASSAPAAGAASRANTISISSSTGRAASSPTR